MALPRTSAIAIGAMRRVRANANLLHVYFINYNEYSILYSGRSPPHIFGAALDGGGPTPTLTAVKPSAKRKIKYENCVQNKNKKFI